MHQGTTNLFASRLTCSVLSGMMQFSGAPWNVRSQSGHALMFRANTFVRHALQKVCMHSEIVVASR